MKVGISVKWVIATEIAGEGWGNFFNVTKA